MVRRTNMVQIYQDVSIKKVLTKYHIESILKLWHNFVSSRTNLSKFRSRHEKYNN